MKRPDPVFRLDFDNVYAVVLVGQIVFEPRREFQIRTNQHEVGQHQIFRVVAETTTTLVE